MAYGPLALKPWEFGDLIPGEFFELCKGYRWRAQREENNLAWLAANIMTAITRKQVNVSDLLPEGKDQAPPKSRDEEVKDLRDLNEELKGKKAANG